MVIRPETPSMIIEDYQAYYSIAQKAAPHSRGIVIGTQPCLTPFLTNDICERYICRDHTEIRPFVEQFR